MRSTQLSPPGKATRVTSAAVLLLAALFGLVSLNHIWSMLHHELSWSNRLLMWAISPDFLLGDAALIEQATRNYTRGFVGIGTHTLLAGIALMLCSAQFVPSLRRRSPQLHRVLGLLAAITTTVSMLGAIAYLWRTPAADGFSGEFFVAGLWVLALSTLSVLGMAMRSIYQRQVRAHMAWMGLLMACLMTAPLLRVGYVLMGHLTGWHLPPLNAGLSAVVMSMSVLLVSWWLHRVGRHDIGLMQAHPGFASSTLKVMVGAALLTVLHEGLLAPLGFDALSAWRSHAQTLPLVSALWALALAALLPRIPGELAAVMKGEPIQVSTLSLAALSGLGAACVAWQLPSHTPNEAVRTFVFGQMALLALGTAVAGWVWREQGLAMQRWRVLSLYLWLTPAGWVPMGLMAAITGWPFDGIWATALGLSTGSFAWNGYAAAFGLRLAGMPALANTPAPAQGQRS
jgi:hypothetical protein